MNPKGISFLELHVEKIVLGVAALLVAGLVARQLITEPNAVQVGTQEVSPARVDTLIRDKAVTLEGALQSRQGLGLNEIERAADWFERQRAEPLVASETPDVALVRPTVLKVGDQGVDLSGGATYAAFEPEAPSDLTVLKQRYSLDPDTVAQTPELAAMLPEEPPYDLTAVHVMATVKPAEIRSELTSPQVDQRAIPTPWWEQDMSILDVRVERQQLEGEGEWSEPEVVATIPGQLTWRDRLDALQPGEIGSLLAEVRSADRRAYQPGLYKLSDGTEWSPRILEELGPMDPEVEAALREMNYYWNRVLETRQQLTRFDEQQESRDQRPGGETPGMGEGGRGFGEGGAPPTRDDTDREKDAMTRRREALQSKIDQATEAYQAAKDKVLELRPTYDNFPDEEPAAEGTRDRRFMPPGEGAEPFAPGEGFSEGGPLPGLGGEGGFEGARHTARDDGVVSPRDRRYRGESGALNRSMAFFEQEEIKVWAHDLGVTPGATYRYRLQVAYFNPFYGREGRLAPEQRDLANEPTTLSIATEWSDPVRIASDQQFFAVDGRYRPEISDRSATFEVYTFTGGEYRMATVTAKPGEAIGEVKTIPGEDEDTRLEINFTTGATLLDVLDAAGAGGQMDRRSQVLVATEEGEIVIMDPDDQRQDEERQRLLERVAKGRN